MTRLLTMFALAVAATGCEAEKPGNTVSRGQQNAPFEIREGNVYLPAWDDNPVTSPVDILTLKPEDFEKPALVYSGQVLMTGKFAPTRELTIPTTASQLAVIWAGSPVEDIFPRAEVSVLPAGDSSFTTRTIYAGFVVSRGSQQTIIPLPPEVLGKKARLRFDLKNPAMIHDRRTLYITSATFR